MGHKDIGTDTDIEASIGPESPEEGWMSYEAVANATGLTTGALRIFVFNHEQFKPAHRRGRRAFFDAAQVSEMVRFMQVNTFQVKREDEESLSLEEALAWLHEQVGQFEQPSLVYYYQRRYGRLFPDAFKSKGPGSGRPSARYFVSSLQAFADWYKAGKPEDASERIAETKQDAEGVHMIFADGVHVLLSGDEARISPHLDDEAARPYVERAWAKMETKRVRKNRKKVG